MTPALLPHFLQVNDGYFVSVRNFEYGQLVYHYNAQGALVHGDTLTLGECFYSFAYDGEPRLVSQQYDIEAGHWVVRTVAYEFDGNATLVDSTLIRRVDLAAGENNAGYAFQFNHGVLTVVAGSVTPGASLNNFRVWLTSYDGEAVMTAPPWDPGPLPIGAYITHWGVLRTSDARFVLAAFVRNDAIKELWFMGLDGDGTFNGSIHTQGIDSTHALNGLRIAEHAGSVVYAITEITADGSFGGGAQVAAFPLTTLLDAPDSPMPLPFELSLGAYPNPFNAQTQLTFTLAHATTARLAVYDLLGREVATIAQQTYAPGRQQVVWDAGDLASGRYFVRLTADHATRVLPLTLMK
ncbi:MAG: T9SS type A sorting domain-containing protein [bacterium]|nr:T9SS type A sorting domain-containing protein [bacterium]